jgi:tetratricopeptide (TPR) repeat protein
MTRSRSLILVTSALIIFFVTYLLAWWDAYRLSQTYVGDANASYEEGRFLDALVGYEKYSESAKKYVEYGGYMQVKRIWSDDYAFPRPSEVEHAQTRIDDIIYARLTIDDAEQFVQENIGRSNPYMGLIYLRLGELYEANGQLADAEDIYASVADLFPNEAALIEQARLDLENLQQKQNAGN